MGIKPYSSAKLAKCLQTATLHRGDFSLSVVCGKLLDIGWGPANDVNIFGGGLRLPPPTPGISPTATRGGQGRPPLDPPGLAKE